LTINDNEIFVEERSKEERIEESMTTPNSMWENENSMKLTFKNLHEQKMKWRPHGRNYHAWVFSYINDESKVDVQIPQVMCYMLCYENQ
jgi:hypothetical protein